MSRVLVLNSDYTFMGLISWQRSIVLMYQGKVETVKETDTIIHNTDKTVSFVIPKVIRLIKYTSQIFKNKIPYSKQNVFIRDDYKCQYCGIKMPLRDCTVDHVVPKSKGGNTSWTNIVTSCKKCNNKKGDLSLHKTGMTLIFNKYPTTPTVSSFMKKKSQEILDVIGDLWSETL